VAVTQEMPLLPIPVSEFAPVFVALAQEPETSPCLLEVG
jgi:hypothetical protein